jgi:hypothetical protein
MMSDAIREIRAMEYQALERRRRTTPRRLMHRLDGMIEELEEMNLDRVSQIPESFIAELRDVGCLVSGSTEPNRWPTTVTAALEYCFDLQDHVRLRHDLGTPLNELH